MLNLFKCFMKKAASCIAVILIVCAVCVPPAHASGGDTANTSDDVDIYGGLTIDEVQAMLSELPEGALGTAVVKAAYTRLGDPVSLAKRGTGDFVDCSYFTMWAYQQAGFTLPSTSVEQAIYCYRNGYTIEKADLQPGDLIFWSKTTCDCGRWHEIHHVAIYFGNDYLIESRYSKGHVVLDKLWGLNKGKWRIFVYAHPEYLID